MLFTFGHTTSSHEQAWEQLARNGVKLLVDVRSHPESKANPQWNKDAIEAWGYPYVWLPNLGGWSEHLDPTLTAAEVERFTAEGVKLPAYLKGPGTFPKGVIGSAVKGQDPDIPAWRNRGLLDYSWFTATPAFRNGIAQLLELEKEYGTLAYMCVEVLWWKCHRSMISDFFAFHGIDTYHITPEKRTNPPASHLSVKTLPQRLRAYEDEIKATWEGVSVG